MKIIRESIWMAEAHRRTYTILAHAHIGSADPAMVKKIVSYSRKNSMHKTTPLSTDAAQVIASLVGIIKSNHGELVPLDMIGGKGRFMVRWTSSEDADRAEHEFKDIEGLKLKTTMGG